MEKLDTYCDYCRKPRYLVWRGNKGLVPWTVEYRDNSEDFQDEEYWFCSFDCLHSWARERAFK